MDSYEQSVSDTAEYKKAKQILKTHFGYDNFKQNQYKIIHSIIRGIDILAILPTGYGKSLCFQIIPLLTDKLIICVSPLVALMEDQQSILRSLNISCCCWNSQLSKKEKIQMEKNLIEGVYKILYITPESMVSSYDMIQKIYKNCGISMIAIDEAHCLSSYGFDFRPAYREITGIRDVCVDVPILAVTATATRQVADDIVSVMCFKNYQIIKSSFDRPNIKINVGVCAKDILETISKIHTKNKGSTIIYCLTKKDTEMIAKSLTKVKILTKAYHSGLDKDERTSVQNQFMSGKINCISATIAFGMGINKSDVRTVIHYGCPQNIESYYQEIGRAGRDGLESECYLFYRQKDFIIQQRFISDIKDIRYKMIRTKLLQTISQYTCTKECRRKYILEYFGEKVSNNICMGCDVCHTLSQQIITESEIADNLNKSEKDDDLNKSKAEESEKLSATENKIFRQICTTIHSIKLQKNHTYGATIIQLILKGSSAVKIKPWMRKLTYYGSMKGFGIIDVNKFIQKAISIGYLQTIHTNTFAIVLDCTDKGIEICEID
jgi:RecQ family ATP-dependent DNA helicase